MIYCVIPAELGPELHERLRSFYRDDANVEVVVDRRRGEGERGHGRARYHGRERRRRAGARATTAAPPRPRRLPPLPPSDADKLVWTARDEPLDREREDLDTAALAAAAQRGDGRAFGALYLRYFDRVYSYLRTMLADPHEAEDVTQEVFVRVFEGLPRYQERGGPSFRVWLFTIARNSAVTRLRRAKFTALLDDADEILTLRAREEVVEDPIAPEDLLARDVMRVAAGLSDIQRRVLMLRYSAQWKRAEVAGRLGISTEAVRKHEKRAKDLLRQRLEALRDGPRARDRMPSLIRLKPMPVMASRRWALWQGPAGHRR